MTLLYKADPVRGQAWRRLFQERAPDIEFRHWPEVGNAEEIRYLACWQPPEELASRLPNLEVLFATSAGIDQFDLSRLPPELPVVRMLDPGIVAGMVEYATLMVLALHRQLPRRGAWPRSDRPGGAGAAGKLRLRPIGLVALAP